MTRLVTNPPNYSGAVYLVPMSEEEPEGLGDFLGYDVTDGDYSESLVWDGINLCYEDNVQLPGEPAKETQWRRFRPVMCVLQECFETKRNSLGLFSSLDTAQQFRGCIVAVAPHVPGFFLSAAIPGSDFEVVRVYACKQGEGVAG